MVGPMWRSSGAWSSVTPADNEAAAPSARSKHSATLCGGNVYLLGGRNGNVPLKDLWRYSLAEGVWKQLKPGGERPPCLQEHTAVAHRERLYVFGGEVSFSNCGETPLWVYEIAGDAWRKVVSRRGVRAPNGRRGHTALVHSGHMIIYGGYQDLRGSTGELWAFHFETETWHLLSGSGKNVEGTPPPRHKHSAVIYDDCMWIYGGMTDLHERSDLWRWDIRSRAWAPFKVKPKNTPGPLHSHAACRLPSSMLIFGGERDGHPTNDVWRFSFDAETWEKIVPDGIRPQPRAECVAFAVSELLLRGGGDGASLEARNARTRLRTSQSADKARHSSYLPRNRVSPCERTYVFEPSTRNYDSHVDADADADTPRAAASNGFLREISKLSQLNLSRLAHNKCNYTVLTTGNNDSTESLLRQRDLSQDTAPIPTPTQITAIATPARIVKSKSAHALKKPLPTSSTTSKSAGAITRDPVSVPNFTALSLPTAQLTPVEAARLVFLDSDEERDYRREIDAENELGNMVKRDESYYSHLGYADSPPCPETGVRFAAPCPKLEEASDENDNSTSDYASVETTSRGSSRLITRVDRSKEEGREGPFGFCNPNYMGPDIKALLTTDERDKRRFAKALGTPDSVLEDALGRSTSRHFADADAEENVEMQNMANSHCLKTRHCQPSPVPVPVPVPVQALPGKSRASSASRVVDQRRSARRVHVADAYVYADAESEVDASLVPLYVFVVGGKERGQVTLFKRPVSIWKLRLY